jgi:hypothetical protein
MENGEHHCGSYYEIMRHPQILTSSNSWHRLRRSAHEAVSKNVVPDYHSIQTKEATILVSSLLTPFVSVNPDKHFRRLATSTIMSILYDCPTSMTEHDDAIKGIEEYLLRLGKTLLPGSYLVEIFPWMVHILTFLRYLVVYTDAWPTKIREMEARSHETIY